MSKIIEDLITLENALIELKGKMEYTFNTMRDIDVEGMNKNIKKCNKEEVEKMKDINKLLEDVDRYWNRTLL